MLGAFALPRLPAWMIGLAAPRLRNLYARRRSRRRPSACRIAEPRHHRAEGAESDGNSDTNQPTAMFRVNGASPSGDVGVRFIHRWQYAKGESSTPSHSSRCQRSNARSAQHWLATCEPETGIRNLYRAKRPRYRDVAKWHTQTGTERTSQLTTSASSRTAAAPVLHSRLGSGPSEHGWRRGELGAVVDLHAPDGLEVEFALASGKTQALVSLSRRLVFAR